jgi:AAA+ ATPase superfamily predicted ATPase
LNTPQRIKAVSLTKCAAIIGREKEIDIIRDCIRRRKGLHIHGPKGVGKSALLDHLHKNWDVIGASCVTIYCKNSVTLREILVCIAEALLGQFGPLAGTNKYLEPIEIGSTSDIRTNSNRDLRNMIFPRIEQGDYCFILDHLDHITQGINAFLSSLHERACVITASRQSWVIGDYSFTGKIAYCLYLVPKLRMDNLNKKDALNLMQQLYKDLGMKLPDKVRVFNDIFHITQGNPKMIQNLLNKAGKPDYIVDGKLNLNLIVIDCRIDAVKIP